ncbi:MAG: hypothetical protein JSR82_21850 [Verrucomicrobia bacterium]|nr:hypothetical protein [Verrucomicrobiota bacterium]
MDDAERKRQLLLELARARAAMARAGGGVREGLDFKTRLKHSVHQNPAWWIGGAAAGLGVILLVARVRRPKVVVAPPRKLRANEAAATEAAAAVAQPVAAGAAFGVVATVGRWLLPVLKPLVMSWIAKKAGEWLGAKDAEGREGR